MPSLSEPRARRFGAPGPAIGLLCDDAGLRARILSALSVDLLEVAVEGEDAGALLPAGGPRIGIVVVALRGHSPQRPMSEVCDVAPEARLILVEDPPGVGRAMRRVRSAEVDAIVAGSQLEVALAPTVRAVWAGHIVVPRAERRLVGVPSLSHREKQVLRLVVDGRTNDEIAEVLYLSKSTVKSHLTTAFAKLAVHSRHEAATLLLDPEQPVGHAVLGVDGRAPLRAVEATE